MKKWVELNVMEFLLLGKLNQQNFENELTDNFVIMVH